MINLVSTRRQRQQQERDRQRTAASVLASSLRLSASELEDLTRQDTIDPQQLDGIIKRIRDDAQLLQIAGGAA